MFHRIADRERENGTTHRLTRRGNTHDSLNREREREIEKERKRERKNNKEGKEYREYTLICVAVLSDHHASGTFTRKLGQLYGTRNRWCVCSCVLWLASPPRSISALTESTDPRTHGRNRIAKSETEKGFDAVGGLPWNQKKNFNLAVPFVVPFPIHTTRRNKYIYIYIYIFIYTYICG